MVPFNTVMSIDMHIVQGPQKYQPKISYIPVVVTKLSAPRFLIQRNLQNNTHL